MAKAKDYRGEGLISRAFLIRPDQLRAMKRIERVTGLSLNEILRRLVDIGLRHWMSERRQGGDHAEHS